MTYIWINAKHDEARLGRLFHNGEIVMEGE